jgi:hypothetical protein
MPMYSVQSRPNKIIGYERNCTDATGRYPSPTAEIETKSAMADQKVEAAPAVPAVPQERRRTKVRFNGRVAVKETIHRNDYTDEELFYTWFRKSDFTKMKLNFQFTVQLLSANRYPGDSDEMTSRGLEYRHRAGATKRKTNKLNALYAVLDEQERQWQEGYENDDELSHVYITNNLHCRNAAQFMGQKDQDACQQINGNAAGAVMQDDDDDNNNNEEEDDDDNMSLSSDESMDLAASGGKPTKLVRKTSGFARFFKKERGATDVSS